MVENKTEQLSVTCGNREILTYRWAIRPANEPNHSIIIEVDKCFPQRSVEYGPVPDVLIGEVIHELKEARRQAIQDCVNRLLKR